MLKRISHISIFVPNQDEALAYYTNKLGFEVHTDALWDDFRWLTISPSHKEFEIVLVKAANPEQEALIGKQGAGMPLCVFITDNCHAEAARLKANGVQIVKEPTQEPWGIECLFQDLYGNLFDMVQKS